nr:uncharacterized protein LOC113738144 [Coffea arabica]
MKSYLDANDLWDVVEIDPVPELSEDPTIAEMRAHRDAVKRRSKAMTCIHSAVSDAVFTKIMTCETAKEAWNALKVAFQDSRVVEKVLVSLPERFEVKISSLEDSRDLSRMTLPELINALEAQEQRRAIRSEEVIECAFQAINKDQIRQGERNCQEKIAKMRRKMAEILRVHTQMGHMERVCKNKGKREHHVQMVDEQDEEQLFMATCFASNNFNTETWLIDSGCTHHMAYDESIFRKLDKSQISKVRIGNGDYIEVKGKGSVAIDYGSDPNPIPIPVDSNHGGVEIEQREAIDSNNTAIDEFEQETPLAPSPPQDVSRRSIRERRPSNKYNLNEYVFLTDGGEPKFYNETGYKICMREKKTGYKICKRS